MVRKEDAAIDTILETLYATDVQGYQVLDAKLLKSEAIKRIHRTLARLDMPKRRQIEDEANYRLERFEKFSHLTDEQRVAVVRIAKERRISIEEAYVIASAKP
jgi:hypothetical protein